MNMGTAFAVYATLREETGCPYTFPDETEAANGEAFNVVNGDVFRLQRIWGRIADLFGAEPAPFDDAVRRLGANVG